MVQVRKWWHACSSPFTHMMRVFKRFVNKGPVAWGIILLASVLFLYPYTLHGLTVWTLGPYTILSLLPITIGSLLCARRGALLAWFITMAGLLLAILAKLGATWVSWQISFLCIALSELIVAFVTGHLRFLSMQLHQAYEQLEKAHVITQLQALTDGLTGLPNHGAVVKEIETELLHCQSSQRDCAIIFVDIDHFKQINDTWGHAAGDAALCTVGQRLRAGIRQGDHLGRYGGEEFAILLSNIEQAQALDMAERLRCAIADIPCLVQDEETKTIISIPLTASFGLAVYPLDGLVAKELLEVADTAMYTAKHTGRNRVCLSDEVDMAIQPREDNDQQEPQHSEQSMAFSRSHVSSSEASTYAPAASA